MVDFISGSTHLLIVISIVTICQTCYQNIFLPYCVNICVTLREGKKLQGKVRTMRKMRTKKQIWCSERQKAKEIIQREWYCFIVSGILIRLRKRAVKSKAQEIGLFSLKFQGVGKSSTEWSFFSSIQIVFLVHLILAQSGTFRNREWYLFFSSNV